MDPTITWEMIVQDIKDLHKMPNLPENQYTRNDIRDTLVAKLRDLAAWIDRGGRLPNTERQL